MKIEETGMYCLNSTSSITSADTGENQGSATVIIRVDNLHLSDERAAKIKEIHERAAADVKAALIH